MTDQAIGSEAEVHAPLQDLLSTLASAGQGPRVSLGEIMNQVGDTSFVAVLVVPALLVVSPLSGIPLFSSICGLTIAFVAGQMVMPRRHLWLPGFLSSQSVDRTRLHKAVAGLGGAARWIDRHATGHAAWAMRLPVRKVCELACLFAGLAMPFLELVPFSSSLLGLAVILLSVAMLARDMMFMAFGAALMTGALSIPFFAVKAMTS